MERAGQEGPLKAATEVALRSHGAIRPDQGREYAQITNRAERQAAINALNRILRPIEERNLRRWAEEHALMLDSEEFTQRWREQGEQGETEHEIYFDDESQRWFKRNNLIYHGNWLEYFYRIWLHNWLFPIAPLEFHGLMEVESLRAVVSQPDVQAVRGATRDEVENLMARLNFRRTDDDNYESASLGIRVEDLHEENVLVKSDGLLVVIDPVPYLTVRTKLARLKSRYSLVS